MGDFRGQVPVDHLIRRMYGAGDLDLDDLRKLDARQLAALKDFLLEKLSVSGPIDKDQLKQDIIDEMKRLLT